MTDPKPIDLNNLPDTYQVLTPGMPGGIEQNLNFANLLFTFFDPTEDGKLSEADKAELVSIFGDAAGDSRLDRSEVVELLTVVAYKNFSNFKNITSDPHYIMSKIICDDINIHDKGTSGVDIAECVALESLTNIADDSYLVGTYFVDLAKAFNGLEK